MEQRGFEIVLAQTAGFCMGVQRAVRIVLDAAENPATPLPIRTPGPLIHNQQVLDVLERRGVLAAEHLDRERGGAAVVRAHGLSREARAALAARCEQLLDATCPHVRHLQEIVEDHARRGYMCIVLGDRGHAEVDGVLGYAGAAGHVVAGPDEVDDLPDAEKVVVVAQTTQNDEVFRATVERVRQRYGNCEAFDTICRSTAQRQEEVRRLAGQVDAMIVVGSRNSANTRRLAEISAAMGKPTYHVETERELDVDQVLRYSRVGLTAGASTPNWMIRRVVLRLENEHRRRTQPVRHLLRRGLRDLIYANLWAGGAVAALTYTGGRLLRPAAGRLPACMGAAFAFVLSQQLLNQYARRESMYISEPARSDFFMVNERRLLALGVIASLGALALGAMLGPWVFGLVALGSVGGLVYRLRLPGPLAARLRMRAVAQMPASKELFVALAWGSMAAVAPALAGGSRIGSAVAAFCACALMAFERTVALDLRDVQTDQLVGRETLVRLAGAKAAARLLLCLVVLEVVLLVTAATLGWLGPLAYGLPAGSVYGLGCLALMRHSHWTDDVAELVVDARFYLMAALALLWAA